MEWMQMGIRIHPAAALRIEDWHMTNQEPGQPPARPLRPSQENTQYLSTRGLIIVFAGLAAALVLGYLFVNKLTDMSQEEDCALAHRYNCGAVEVPR